MATQTKAAPVKTQGRARKSYEARTGMDKRASTILVSAIFVKIAFSEDESGNRIRAWKSSEMSSYSNSDIASCLISRVAIDLDLPLRFQGGEHRGRKIPFLSTTAAGTK